MVTSKVDKVASELSSLLSDNNHHIWSSLDVVTESEDELAICFQQAAFYVLTISTDFYRRFTRLCRSYPFLYLWLIYAPPDTLCTDRWVIGIAIAVELFSFVLLAGRGGFPKGPTFLSRPFSPHLEPNWFSEFLERAAKPMSPDSPVRPLSIPNGSCRSGYPWDKLL